MKSLCEFCDKPLKLIGKDRKNGKPLSTKDGRDWDTRKYHKKCIDLARQELEYLEKLLQQEQF